MIELIARPAEVSFDQIEYRLTFANAAERDLVEATLVAARELAIALGEIEVDARRCAQKLASVVAT